MNSKLTHEDSIAVNILKEQEAKESITTGPIKENQVASVVDAQKEATKPATIESYGKSLLNSMSMLVLIIFAAYMSAHIMDLSKNNVTELLKSITSESFGKFSFIMSVFLTIICNGVYLIVNDDKWVQPVNRMRLQVQDYQIGLYGTILLAGFLNIDEFERTTIIYTSFIIIMVMASTWITGFINTKFIEDGRKDLNTVVGIIYICVLLFILYFNKEAVILKDFISQFSIFH